MYQLPSYPITRKAFKFTWLAVFVFFLLTHQSHAMNFQVQLESEADVGSNEVLYITYNSFTDLTGSIEAGSFFSPVNISGAYSTTGLAYDGNKGGSGGVIPEPSTMLLFGTGLAGLAGWRWRKPR